MKLPNLATITLILCGVVVTSFAQPKISKPGVYSGYQTQTYDGWKRFSQYVSVRDGTKLAVDIYRPTLKGEVVTTPLPVVWQFTPYRRATLGKDGQITPSNSFNSTLELTRYGYVAVLADTRGKGASFGLRQAPHNRVEAEDSYDLMEWLGTQKWSTGKIGMAGGSYLGGTVENAVTTMSPYLKAVFFGITDFNMYDGWVRGGIFRYTAGADTPYTDDLQTVPVDEDADKTMLKAAVEQHKQNASLNALMNETPFRDSWSNLSDSYWWTEVSFSSYLDEIKRSGVPAYMYGGWYDFLRRDTVISYANWPHPKKMVIGPWAHGGSAGFDFAQEQLRWFDAWLKGIDNGILKEPPLWYHTINASPGNEWRFAAQWPPTHNNQIYFLQGGKSGTAPSINDGKLATTAPQDETAKDEFKVVYGITAHVEPLGMSPPYKGATEWDQKGLTWTSDPLPADTKVAGHPLVSLWLSSSADDADVFVYLEDVDAGGNSVYVSDGRLRASLRAVHPPSYHFLDLPWHRAYKQDEHKLTPGQPVRLLIDLMPTATVFKAGHRIRLAVTGSQGRTNFQQRNPAPTFSLYRDSVHASYVSLPIAR